MKFAVAFVGSFAKLTVRLAGHHIATTQHVVPRRTAILEKTGMSAFSLENWYGCDWPLLIGSFR